MQKIDEEAIRAAADRHETEAFIMRYRNFILQCASRHARKYVTDSDDEWSVAMTAFSEALHTYEINKGPFLSFANLVIRRRITDHIRSDARFFCERSVDPSAFHGQIDEDAEDAALQTQVLSRTVGENDGCVRLEIEAVGEILLKYGFSFYDLVSNSPKSKKTKESCATVIRCLLEKPLLISATRNGGALPAKTISTCTGVNRKILERHRKYIIASMEILTGDFPFLAEYLSHIKTK